MPVRNAPGSDWIWTRERDLLVFGGAAVAALGLGFGLRGVAGGVVPEWAWLAFVLGLDVAHVWSTLFRTYLDQEELRQRRLVYGGVPLACYALGCVAYHVSARFFWGALAYVAVFHFVRQQAGWLAIARARAKLHAPIDRRLDDAVIFCATGVPLVHWHAHLPRSFHWFVEGDFVAASSVTECAKKLFLPASVVYGLLAVAYVVRSLQHARSGRSLWTKHLVVVSTAAVWWGGIVLVDDDFTFTVTNVTLHAVPYLALLWGYAQARSEERPGRLVARFLGAGFCGFFTLLLGLAFVEEFVWDRLVWHERTWLFGAGNAFDGGTLAWLVPLLALPQATHYVLDGLLWRQKDGGRAQARALGFAVDGARTERDPEA